MYIRNASASKIIEYMFLGGCLALMYLLAGSSLQLFAQSDLNLAEPLKKCRVYGGNNGIARIIASDNIHNLILTNDNFSVISMNLDFGTETENWKTLSGGYLESQAIDTENLFLVTSFENVDRKKSYILNSISLGTGITNWQLKINEHYKVLINEIADEKVLILMIDDTRLMAVSKDAGKIIWTKEYIEKIVDVNKSVSDLEELYILSGNGLTNIQKNSGQIINEFKFKSNEISIGVIGRSFVLNGYPTGDIIKVSIGANQNDVIWKIKAGGGISGLVPYKDEILVTSLDNFIYLYSIENGKLRWKRRVAGRINIEPRIYGDLAIVLNSGNNAASVIDLRDGKVINQIQVEEETYFTGQPFVLGKYLIFQTSKGIYFFSGANQACK